MQDAKEVLFAGISSGAIAVEMYSNFLFDILSEFAPEAFMYRYQFPAQIYHVLGYFYLLHSVLPTAAGF
jgi:hypothetical protein